MLPRRLPAGLVTGTIVLATIAIVSAGCQAVTISGTIVGSGTPATEQRSVGAFDGLKVGTAIQARVTIGTPATVRVTADDNLLGHVNTTVSAGTLEVAFGPGSVSTRTPVVVEITAPSLTSIEAGSAAAVAVAGLSAGDLRVHADSAGRISASGSATSLSLTGDSGASVDLSNLGARTAQVDLASAAAAQVKAAERVSGSVKEGASLVLIGVPSTVEVSSQTGGSVSYR